MEIRQVRGEELAATAIPLEAEAFSRATQPAGKAGRTDRFRTALPYREGDITLIAAEAGITLAAATAIPMRQNVRGAVYPMAGVASVVTHPAARRQGHMRTLLTRLLGDMRDSGHAVSTLYPFRPSFYERLGYATLRQPQTVTFATADLLPLLRDGLPGEAGWQRIGEGFGAYCDFTEDFLRHRHGFAVFPGHRAARLRDLDDRWLLTARSGGDVLGMVTYRIQAYGGDLVTDPLLATSPLGRALLLQFLARYADQVSRIRLRAAPDETPELWATDIAICAETRTAFPDAAAPMARVLSVGALAGQPAGPGRAAVEVVDDPFIAGSYLLNGSTGTLEVTRGRGEAGATLTAAGLAALVYGVLGPAEVALRGLGSVPDEVAGQLQALFPRCAPYLVAAF